MQTYWEMELIAFVMFGSISISVRSKLCVIIFNVSDFVDFSNVRSSIESVKFLLNSYTVKTSVFLFALINIYIYETWLDWKQFKLV